MSDRLEKFKAKLNGDTRKQRIDAQKPQMIKLYANETEHLIEVEKKVKIITNGESTIYIPYYIIFGKEIYKKQKIFKQQTLLNEVEILQAKWIKRGLKFLILDKIKKLFVQEYPLSDYFIMDLSLLDGNDRLA